MRLRPTRFGVAFLGLVVLTLIGCINYGLSLGYGLTFLLGGVWTVTAAQATRLARTLHLTLRAPDEGAAGRACGLPVTLHQEGAAVTARVQGRVGRARAALTLDLPAGGSASGTLAFPPLPRGRHRLEDVEVSAFDALGLWAASLPVPGSPEWLVPPAPEANAPAPPTLAAGRGEEGSRVAGQEDFAGLRPYVPGDAPRLISWRHTARTGALVTREFDAPAGQAWALDWDETRGAGDEEARLSRLAAWVTAAQAAGVPFRFSLPGTVQPVAAGEAQVRAARRALALYGAPPTAPQASVAVTRPPLPGPALRFSLLALAAALLPLFLRQPVWNTALVGGVLLYTGLRTQASGRLPPLPGALLLLLALLGGLGLNAAYGTLLGAEAGTALLALLTALKAAETRTVRDARLLGLLGLFLTSTHFFLDQGPLTAGHSVLASGLLLAAAARWVSPAETAPSSPLWPRARLGVTGRLLVLALPLAGLLFALFPRPDGPLWQLPVRQSATTGLADEISAGEYSDLAQSGAVAFRADFSGALPPPEERYWRGPVYETYDGLRWGQVRGAFYPADVRPLAGAPTWSYTLTLEPNGKPWLLTLDVPVQPAPGTGLTGAFQSFTPRPSGARTRSAWQSRPARLGVGDRPERLEFNLQLPSAPQARNPRARALAASWRTLAPEARVRSALRHFAEGNFAYTLSPPTLPEVNRIDAFLFGTRQGFCEHYASAFTFLMRAAGVPARIVGGYQGGEINPNGDYLIVRQRDAHAWTEVWLAGQGWVRVDPTAATAPARVRADLPTALARPGATTPGERTALDALRLRFDALQNSWNIWVVGYDGAQQRSLLARLGVREVGSPTYLLGVAGLAGLALLPALLAMRRAALPQDPARRALAELAQRLGLPRAPGETAGAYAERAARQFPAQAERLDRVARQFNALRYGPAPSAQAQRELEREVRAVRRRER
ncbi:Uncharacterized conserved protein, DUF58 family, contains vWF domain [Deinococcus reticulitermitis]|uniref:Uncharacterized conserved protein, DUF58 family, contains vWF domain n=1 Tax=Deinococcus reticulitermitis TaxID=856736 RepID=A0A1H6U4J2_9DEIO|nr:transglutaminaseTgpA domain-containing protein [Deinococcus reticulitermitis]SEI87213.1 Uncharacterized conserved protein, DUF58 family, contains vWF domain [Deinococcus reticulitermitis]